LKDAIKSANPGAAVVASRDYQLRFFSFPSAQITPVPDTELNAQYYFAPPYRRGDPGGLLASVQYGVFTVNWHSRTYLLYVTEFYEGSYSRPTQLFFVHKDEQAIHDLLLASSEYAYQLHEEILVFVHGSWIKDKQLWQDIQSADWDDVILDATFKKRLQDDINGFFASEEVYKELSIPWKRGIIFMGPPGNGKTISLKAVMKASTNPVLYVRNFTSFMGDEASMQAVFSMARRMAPCILVLEDLDSLITNRNRSFFLNELDGLHGNDGLLLIASTNHFDQLDPALSNRPSRFDRKFEFGAPTYDERILYVKYWQKKLKDNEDISFPDDLVEEIAKLTDRFSFAYLKEAMVSTLVVLAGEPGRGFEDVLKEQIASLRKSIDEGHEE